MLLLVRGELRAFGDEWGAQIFLPFFLLLWTNVRILYEIKRSFSTRQMRKKSRACLRQHSACMDESRGMVDPTLSGEVGERAHH